MNSEIILPKNYELMNQETLDGINGGITGEAFLAWVGLALGTWVANKVFDHAGSWAYSKLVDALKHISKPGYQKWVSEFNRHRYCCAGNGIGKGCPGGY